MQSVKKRLLQEADNLVLVDGRVESLTQNTLLGQKPPLQETIDNASTFSDISKEYIGGKHTAPVSNEKFYVGGPYEKTGTDVKYKMAIYNYPQMTGNNVFPAEVTNDLRMGVVTKDKYMRIPTEFQSTNQFLYSCDYFNGTLINTDEQCAADQKGWQWGRLNVNSSAPSRVLFTGNRALHWSSDLLSINAYPSVVGSASTAADVRFAQVVRPPSSTSFMYYRFTTNNSNLTINIGKYNTTSFFLKKDLQDPNQPQRHLFMLRFGRLSLASNPVATNIDDLGAHYLIFDTKDCRLVYGEHNPKVKYISSIRPGGQLKGEYVDRIHYEDYPNGWVRITISTKEWHDGILVAGLQIYNNPQNNIAQGYVSGLKNVGIENESMVDVGKRWVKIWRDIWNKPEYTFQNNDQTTLFDDVTKRNNFLIEYRNKVTSTDFPYSVGPYMTCNVGWWQQLRTPKYKYELSAPVYKYQDYTPKDQNFNGFVKSGNDVTFGKYENMAAEDRPTKLTLLITLRFEHTKYNEPVTGGLFSQWPYIPGKPNNGCYYLQVEPLGIKNDGVIPLVDGEDHTIVFVIDRDENPVSQSSNAGKWPVYYRGEKYIQNYGPYPSLRWFIRGRTSGEYIKEFAIWEKVLTDNEIFSLIEE